MRDISIRKATAKDIEAMVRIRKTAFTDEEVKGFTPPGRSFFYSATRLRKEWKEDNKLKGDWEIYVAEDKRGVIGYIVFKIKNGEGYIDNVNVPKQHQGKGVGKALVLYVEEITRSKGIRIMRTDTTENAQGKPWKSYSFWKKMGYKDTGERLPTEWDFKEIPFVKNLQ